MSAKLRQQVQELAQRRVELMRLLDIATAAHEAQQKLLAGDTTISTESVALHFATIGSLRESISNLDSTVAEVQERLAADEVRVREESARRRLRSIDNELREAEAIYRSSRTRADAALTECVDSAIDSYRQWKKLQDEATSLRRSLGETVTGRPRIQCNQPLTFQAEIDGALARVYDARVRPTREQRKAKVNELNRRMREGEERRRQSIKPAA
jgi:hypothetical protein